MLRKDEILGSDDRSFEVVDVPEWNGQVRVGVMTGTERDEFEAECMRARNGQAVTPNIRARVCAWTMRDEQGNRMFSTADALELGKKSSIALERVYSAAERVNGLTKEALEAILKNSNGGQNE